ncbi:Transient receptor potential cation channel subfamily M member-like 2, partial [Lamellibrachia satsuma]
MSFFPAVNEDEEENTTSCKHPWRDLFVWALLFNRRELADMFWHRTENSTATALVASILLHSLAKKAEKNNEAALRDSLSSHACEFEKQAIGVLKQCYKDNKLDSEELVKMKVDECGDKSILMIANVEHMEFLGETCCDVVIHKQWTGRTLTKPAEVFNNRLVHVTPPRSVINSISTSSISVAWLSSASSYTL